MSQIIDIVGNSKKSFSLLHLFGLRPRVYYTLTNFNGGGGGDGTRPPSIRQWRMVHGLCHSLISLFHGKVLDCVLYYVLLTALCYSPF